MIGIRAHAVAHNLSVDRGATLPSLLQLLEHHDTGPFPITKPSRALSKGRLACWGASLRVESARMAQKPPNASGVIAASQPPLSMHIGIPALNDSIGFPNGVRARGAGRRDAGIGTAQTKHACRHVPEAMFGDATWAQKNGEIRCGPARSRLSWLRSSVAIPPNPTPREYSPHRWACSCADGSAAMSRAMVQH